MELRRPATAVVSMVIASALLASCGGSGTTPVTRAQPSGTAAGGAPLTCEWPMWGQNPSRTFASPCPTALSPSTVKDLRQRWFVNTSDVVTATPTVVDGSLYVGDWSGRFYALDAETGATRWTLQADVHPQVYAGQIVSSAAVADVNRTATVFFGSGQTMYAVHAGDGSVAWKHPVGTGAADDFTEIESSPVVVDGKVVFGIDVHNHEGQRAGVMALDPATGNQLWYFDPEAGQPPSGCVDVWGSPSVDLGRRTVYFGTGSCEHGLQLWTPYSEAIVAVDLDTGAPRWKYQPHQPNVNDLDFAGAPNLFSANGTDVVGLGNKDGSYYAVNRDSGVLVWQRKASGPSATGGFIGPTAYADGIVAGGTAVGPGPFLHGISGADGRILWQNTQTQATYAASAVAGGVLFVGGTDFSFRAVDLHTGEILWTQTMKGAVSGGSAIVGDRVYAVAGIREPGLDKRSENSGVYAFGLPGPGEAATTLPPTTTSSQPGVPVARLTNPAGSQKCIGQPCLLPFTLKPVPAGLSPHGTLEITPDPYSVTVHVEGLGQPQQWIEGGPAASEGATAFGLYISESDDNPVGGLLCILDASGSCTATTLPRDSTYNRITLLALKDTATAPTLVDGLARLITTLSFEPPLAPAPKG
jgi:polyvinyl alcohol dehydrogenase (cytochrome)